MAWLSYMDTLEDTVMMILESMLQVSTVSNWQEMWVVPFIMITLAEAIFSLSLIWYESNNNGGSSWANIQLEPHLIWK